MKKLSVPARKLLALPAAVARKNATADARKKNKLTSVKSPLHKEGILTLII
jgi:hypothetical protein